MDAGITAGAFQGEIDGRAAALDVPRETGEAENPSRGEFHPEIAMSDFPIVF